MYEEKVKRKDEDNEFLDRCKLMANTHRLNSMKKNDALETKDDFDMVLDKNTLSCGNNPNATNVVFASNNQVEGMPMIATTSSVLMKQKIHKFKKEKTFLRQDTLDYSHKIKYLINIMNKLKSKIEKYSCAITDKKEVIESTQLANDKLQKRLFDARVDRINCNEMVLANKKVRVEMNEVVKYSKSITEENKVMKIQK